VDDEGAPTIEHRSQERRRVTPLRLSNGKLSGSRNDTHAPRNAGSCHYCETTFQPQQVRYPIAELVGDDEGVASICADCFEGLKQAIGAATETELHQRYGTKLELSVKFQRYERECLGRVLINLLSDGVS
jgi:hypothetical protein